MSAPYYLGKATYRVASPLVVARLLNGTDLYLYEGDVVPTDIHPQTLDALVTSGAVVKIETAVV